MDSILSLINGRLVINVRNYKDFIQSINSVITENKMLFDKLPLGIQNSLGTDLYGLRQLNIDQYDNILAKSLFQPDQFNKHVNYLIGVFKYLLMTHVSLLLHNKNIQSDEKTQLETKINTMNISVNSTSTTNQIKQPFEFEQPAPLQDQQQQPQQPQPQQQQPQPQPQPQQQPQQQQQQPQQQQQQPQPQLQQELQELQKAQQHRQQQEQQLQQELQKTQQQLQQRLQKTKQLLQKTKQLPQKQRQQQPQQQQQKQALPGGGNAENIYYAKYLKYKTKYLALKKL
jgi:type IV secretory pathway VirB10-like protein